MLERATGTSLPIYHRSIDWDALYERYPVPDVFERIRWRWSPEEIRKFQNEQFLDLVETGWQNEFYKRRWKAEGLEPGDIKSIDDITKLPTFDSADIKKDQEESTVRAHQWRRHQDNAKNAAETANEWRTTGKPRPTLYAPLEWELNGLTHARDVHRRRTTGRSRGNSAHRLARQCRLVLLQSLPRLPRGASRSRLAPAR